MTLNNKVFLVFQLPKIWIFLILHMVEILKGKKEKSYSSSEKNSYFKIFLNLVIGDL